MVSFRPRTLLQRSEKRIDSAPPDGLHEGVDIAGCFGAKIDVVGMLVHVQSQNGGPDSQRMTMVGCPLVHELAVAGGPGEQHPTRAAAESLSHRQELGMPAVMRSKISRQRLFENGAGFTLFPKPVEKEFMQDHRVHCDQLFTFEPVDKKSSRIRIIKFCKLLFDKVEALHGASVVVFVMADNQPF